MTKFTLSTLLGLLLLLGMSLPGCIQDQCTEERTYYTYEPTYMTFEDLRQAVESQDARVLKRPGKMYFKDQFIFISEINEGVHIIDNQDPSSPKNIAFIQVPGVRDMAAKGNILYVDSHTDLVSIDISNPMAVQEVDRDWNVFPYGSAHPGLWADQTQGVAIDWVENIVTDEFDCSSSGWGGWGGIRNGFAMEDAVFLSSVSSNSTLSPNGPSASPGQGGSMARFTLVNEYLYCVTESDLIPFNISDLSNPNRTNNISVGWGIETIFPMKDHLFLGSQTGMFIYNLDNPEQPRYVSEFQHVRACDPVVVEGDYAFVTLRNGEDNACNGFTNQLDVVNISNLSRPYLERSYNLFNPHGLGIREGILFICDGDDGLKVYDASNINEISNNQLAHFPNIHAVDVIPLENILLMIGEDGFYQYDYSDLQNIRQLSLIPVSSE